MNAGLSIDGDHGRVVGGVDVSTPSPGDRHPDRRVRLSIFTGSDVVASGSSSIKLDPVQAREIAGAILCAADEVEAERAVAS